MEKAKLYIVTKSNSDGSVLIDDIVWLDNKGNLWKEKSSDGSQCGWMSAKDLTPSILDFEVKEYIK